MIRLSTLRDLFRHLDWASDRVLAAAESLDDARLDRPFDMGPGSLRTTVAHVWAAHWIWVRRLAGESPTKFPLDGTRVSIADLRRFITETRATRDDALRDMNDERLARDVPYTTTRGEPFVARVETILLHVCNHAVHHHAQALNMLRHNGVAKPPKIDYIFMYFENASLAAPALSVDVLRNYFAYTDWARGRVFDAAQSLDGSTLDRPFEMGIGSIRKNLLHTHDVERFWLANWVAGKGEPFVKSDDTPVPLGDLRARFDETAAKRNDYLAHVTDADLSRDVEGTAGPGRTFTFPMGVTMLQLNVHATHHRAQTINMLRQCGLQTPATDYTVWAREAARRD